MNGTNMRSAMQILPELREGRAILELTEQIYVAIAAVKQYGKAARVSLDITIAPGGKGYETLIEAPLLFAAEVSAKLPEPDPEKTLMFVDRDGNPTRNPAQRQKELGLSVAPVGDTKPVEKGV